MSDYPPVDAQFRVMKPGEQSNAPVIKVNVSSNQPPEQKQKWWERLFGRKHPATQANQKAAEAIRKTNQKSVDAQATMARVQKRIDQQQAEINQMKKAEQSLKDLKRETEIETELTKLKQVAGRT